MTPKYLQNSLLLNDVILITMLLLAYIFKINEKKCRSN